MSLWIAIAPRVWPKASLMAPDNQDEEPMSAKIETVGEPHTVERQAGPAHRARHHGREEFGASRRAIIPVTINNGKETEDVYQ